MNNTRRRMLVQKYRNRPPFDLKKKEAMNRHFRKSFQHVEESFKTIMNHLDAMQSECAIDIFINNENKPGTNLEQQLKPKNIAPKIIESFRKATPKRIPLYRNSKRVLGNLKKHQMKLNLKDDVPVETLYKNDNLTLGKNIPDHKIMKNLLEDFKESNISTRIDKSTSTTGIIWPIPQCNRNKVRCNQKVKSNIQRKLKRNMNSKERLPDMRKLKSNSRYVKSFVGSKSSVCQNFIAEGKMRKSKEKSFVKTQVENFNKMSKKNDVSNQGNFEMKNGCKNYLEMMNSVKNKLPKIQPKTEISISDNCDWSSTTEKPPDRPRDIKFPRETKDAIQLMIQDSRRFLKTPLAKYLKHQDSLAIQPAISLNYMGIYKMKSQHTICKKVESNPESTGCHSKDNRLKMTKDGSFKNKKFLSQKPKATI
ncbi:uncharacterized protein LOC130449417 isoform X2 [Diorhabda sublineata]|nr:uncharacterized protein LOC130449417 isoform X2 [Diorhabda sublineata]